MYVSMIAWIAFSVRVRSKHCGSRYLYSDITASICLAFFSIWFHVIRPVPIFVWVLINTNVVGGIRIGACTLEYGCLLYMLHRHNQQHITI